MDKKQKNIPTPIQEGLFPWKNESWFEESDIPQPAPEESHGGNLYTMNVVFLPARPLFFTANPNEAWHKRNEGVREHPGFPVGVLRMIDWLEWQHEQSFNKGYAAGLAAGLEPIEEEDE